MCGSYNEQYSNDQSALNQRLNKNATGTPHLPHYPPKADSLNGLASTNNRAPDSSHSTDLQPICDWV